MTLFVVGNVTEDLIFGLDRLPADGETLIAANRISDIGGKGFNQALIAARSGIAVRLIAPVGRDDAGRRARLLAAAKPFEAVLIDKDTPTDQSLIAVALSGENFIISSAFAARALTVAEVIAAVGDAAPGDQLLLQGNLSQDTTIGMLEWARGLGIRTTVNPSPVQWDYRPLWSLIDRLILNVPELATLSGEVDVENGISALASLGVDEIIVTKGAGGAVMDVGGTRWSVPAAPVSVVDTAGAGDTFCAALLAALQRGYAPPMAMQIAARAAAITIGRSGTWSSFPAIDELTAIFQLSEGQVRT